jgi:hypothetical protein
VQVVVALRGSYGMSRGYCRTSISTAWRTAASCSSATDFTAFQMPL